MAAGVFGSLHVPVADVTVQFWTEHNDGTASYRVEYANDDITVYLTGTPEQLGAFADAIVSAASRHAIEEVERAAR